MPRCLVIAGVFPPAGGAGSLRMVKLLKYLPDNGWEIDVVAPAGRQGWFVDGTLADEIQHLRVLRVGAAFAGTPSRGRASPATTAQVAEIGAQACCDRVREPRQREICSLGGRLPAGKFFGQAPRARAAAWLSDARAVAKDPRRRGFVAARVLPGMMRMGKAVRDHVAIPDEYVGFSAQAARQASLLLASSASPYDCPYDLLLTASFPYSCHLAGLWLRRRYHLPWIIDLADPWAGHRFRGQHTALRGLVDGFLEARVVRACDGISVASPGMQERLQRTYGSLVADKIRVVNNAHDPSDFVGVVAPAALGRASETRNIELVFLGSFDARLTPPDPFLAAFAQAMRSERRVRERLRLRVIGAADLASSGRIRQFLEACDASELLQFESPMTHPQAVAAIRGADALAISVAPGASWHLTAKVLEYIATDRPIVACVPAGDCRNLLESCGGALLFQPHETAELADAIVSAVAYGSFEAPTARDGAQVARYAAPVIARAAGAWMQTVCARSRVTGAGSSREA